MVIDSGKQLIFRNVNLPNAIMVGKKVRLDNSLMERGLVSSRNRARALIMSGKVLVGVRKRGDKAIIQVTDSGIGIPSTKFRTVFKEFARLDSGAKAASGLGLGLSIVDRIARVLGHEVDLESTPGRGTQFRVSLPVAQAEETTTSQPVARKTKPGEPLSAAIPMPAGEAAVTEGILDGQEVDETAVQVMGMLDQVTSMINEDAEGVAAMVERWVQRND